MLSVVSEGFDHEEPGEDDFAGMLSSLDGRLDRSTIAQALGVKERELDLIAIGHAPNAEAGKRLTMLYTLAQRTEGDLTEPATLLEAAGISTTGGRLMVPVSLVPRLKTFLVAFLVSDAIIFGLVVLVFVVRA
jgi:hypothetical protein